MSLQYNINQAQIFIRIILDILNDLEKKVRNPSLLPTPELPHPDIQINFLISNIHILANLLLPLRNDIRHFLRMGISVADIFENIEFLINAANLLDSRIVSPSLSIRSKRRKVSNITGMKKAVFNIRNLLSSSLTLSSKKLKRK